MSQKDRMEDEGENVLREVVKRYGAEGALLMVFFRESEDDDKVVRSCGTAMLVTRGIAKGLPSVLNELSAEIKRNALADGIEVNDDTDVVLKRTEGSLLN